MPNNHLVQLPAIWACRNFAVFQRCQNFPENPRVALCAASDHNAVAAGLLKQPQRTCRVHDIPVADNRNFYRLLYLRNDVPIRRSGIILLPRPAVHRNSRSAGFLRDFCHFNRIDVRIIEALANFYRQGLLNRFCRFFYNFPRQQGIFHQGAALAVACYFGRGAAHVDVYEGQLALVLAADAAGHFGHYVRVTAEKLYAAGTLCIYENKYGDALALVSELSVAVSALPAAAQEEVQDGLGFSTLEELEAWLENMES